MIPINVEWESPNFARINLPGVPEFGASHSRTEGWRTVGYDVTKGWAFPTFDALLSFIQERAK